MILYYSIQYSILFNILRSLNIQEKTLTPNELYNRSYRPFLIVTTICFICDVRLTLQNKCNENRLKYSY